MAGLLGAILLLPSVGRAHQDNFFVLCQVAVMEGGRLGYQSAGEALSRLTSELRAIKGLKDNHSEAVAKLEALSAKIGLREKYLWGWLGGDGAQSLDFRQTARLERDFRSAIARRERELGDFERTAGALLDELVGGILRSEWERLDEPYRVSLSALMQDAGVILNLVERFAEARRAVAQASSGRQDPRRLLDAHADAQQSELKLLKELAVFRSGMERLISRLVRTPGTPQLVALYLQQSWEWVLPKLKETAALIQVLRERLTGISKLLDNPYL
ncbi:MAG: hypothetical protein R3B54_02965 [Bdellovibrionota bacterium]